VLVGCVGTASLDTLLFCEQLPTGGHDTVTVLDDIVITIGGKGLVSALAMHDAGVAALPFAGVGTNSTIAPMLPSDLDSRFVLPVQASDDRIWLIVSGAHEVATLVAVEAFRSRDTPAHASAAEAFVNEIDVVYISVDNPHVVRTVSQLACARDLPIVTNLSLPLLQLAQREAGDLLPQLIEQSNVVLCNERESQLTLEMLQVRDWHELKSSQLREVIVTKGSEGGRWSERPFTGWTRYPAVRRGPTRCVVGAGDTFNGAYIAARFGSGAETAWSCAQGADAAARKVTYRASSLPAT